MYLGSSCFLQYLLPFSQTMSSPRSGDASPKPEMCHCDFRFHMTSSDKVHCWKRRDAAIAWAELKLEEAMRDINGPVDRLQEMLVRCALALAEHDDLKAVLEIRDKKERSAIQNQCQRQRRAEERYHSHHGPYPPLDSEFDY